ncbi:MAG: cold shock domain-containing protein [Psychromonas sp.]
MKTDHPMYHPNRERCLQSYTGGRFFGGNSSHHSIASEGFKTLAEGQKVEFTVSQGQKGPQADNIVAV